MFSKSDKYANIKYEERHTNTIPKEKFYFWLGFINCHKNGIPNNKIGYAESPTLLLKPVNRQIIIDKKYR